MVYTLAEKVFLIKHFYKSNDRYSKCVQDGFRERFNKEPMNRNVLKQLVSKFEVTGSVSDAPRCGRPKVITPRKIAKVKKCIEKSPRKSLKRLHQQVRIRKLSFESGRRILRFELKKNPYKVQKMHQLRPGDAGNRLTFCRWIKCFLQRNGNSILDKTFFSDEAWFHLSGYVNKQNDRIWSNDNPHLTHEVLLHDQKLGVWVAMSRKRIIVLFFNEIVNGDIYRNQLLKPFFKKLTSDEKATGWFQ